MSDEALYVVIMAGGKGSRLWPLSRPNHPKQFLPLLDGISLLQATWRRALRLCQPEQVLVVGDAVYQELYREQLPDLPPGNLLLEPVGRNTAACVALAAVHAHRRKPDSVTIVLPADHVIFNEDEWCVAVQVAAEHARRSSRLVAVGVKADAPEPRFGYMLRGPLLEQLDSRDVFAVERFVEKPDEASLAPLLQSGLCLRNMGTFAWRADSILTEVDAYLPAVSTRLRNFAPTIGTDAELAALKAVYAAMPSISIDHGVLQHSRRLSVVPSDIQRVDVGDFSAFAVLWPQDAQGNAVKGRHVSLKSAGNIIYSPALRVATVGVRDLVIVADGDTVLVCPRSHTQEIKDLLQLIGEEKRGNHHC